MFICGFPSQKTSQQTIFQIAATANADPETIQQTANPIIVCNPPPGQGIYMQTNKIVSPNSHQRSKAVLTNHQ